MNKNNGVWAIACSAHDYIIKDKFFDEHYAVPEKSDNTIN